MSTEAQKKASRSYYNKKHKRNIKNKMSQEERIYIFERMGDFNMSGEDNMLIIKLRKEYKELQT